MGASEDRLLAKVGAEACQGVSDLSTGMGLFLKVEDGSSRAVAPATVEALRQLAWLEGRAFEVLGDWWMPELKNWAGRRVGRIKPVLSLRD
jgi:L-asparaginase II